MKQLSTTHTLLFITGILIGAGSLALAHAGKPQEHSGGSRTPRSFSIKDCQADARRFAEEASLFAVKHSVEVSAEDEIEAQMNGASEAAIRMLQDSVTDSFKRYCEISGDIAETRNSGASWWTAM